MSEDDPDGEKDDLGDDSFPTGGDDVRSVADDVDPTVTDDTDPTGADGDDPTPPSDVEPTPPSDDEPRPTADAGPSDVDSDAPLSDLAERARRSRDAAAGDDVMDAFSEVEVSDVDADVEDLWSELEEDGLEETVDDPRGSTERDVRAISKRDYCQRCQYFSAPPEVRCTHEEGEILEMVDTERFRVADCPILRGEEELENLRR